MKQEQLTAAEETAKRIAEMPLHPDYKFIPDLPIPTGYGVLVKKVREKLIRGTGIIIPGTDHELELSFNSSKSKDENVGIIQAIGPKCGPGLRVGLKCKFLFQEGMVTFLHGIDEFVPLDETSIPFVIPSDETLTKGGLKSDREVGRETRQERQKLTFNVDKMRDDEDANKLEHTKSTKKIHIIKPK
jgi:hypothetical protein